MDATVYCACNEGFRGDGRSCTKVTGCDCQNGGVCADYHGKAVCDCPFWADGDHCELLAQDISMASDRMCLLRKDNTIRCWGWNSGGQSESPQGQFSAVVASRQETWGLAQSGTIRRTQTGTFPLGWSPDAEQPSYPQNGKAFAITGNPDIDAYCWFGETGLADCALAYTAALSDRALVARGSETCALNSDGSVSCWGVSSVNPTGAFTSIAVGGDVALPSFGCGVHTDGALECWGDDTGGQASPPAGAFVKVTAGSRHACALRSDGSASCWGDQSNGQTPPPSAQFDDLAAGDGFTCGVNLDGMLACWGKNDHGQATPPSGTFQSVAAGVTHACGLRRDSTLACWGLDDAGQATPPTGTFTSVTVGNRHSCAIDTNGWGQCWGDSANGEAPFPARPDKITLVPGSPPVYEQWTATLVVAAGDYTCALEGLTVLSTSPPFRPVTPFTVDPVCWGKNDHGQATAPPQRPFDASITSISVGGPMGSEYACGVRTDGSLRCMAPEGGGDWTLPRAGKFKTVSAGGAHTCAIKTDDTVECWGSNDSGESTPPSGTFSSISSVGDLSCGLRPDGTIACWGNDTYTPAAPPGSPTAVGRTHPPAGTFTRFSLYDGGGCALASDGSVACWGGAPFLLPPRGVFESVAAAVAGGSYPQPRCALDARGEPLCFGATAIDGPFVQLALGAYTTCGLRPDGVVRCWASVDPNVPPVVPPSGRFIKLAAAAGSLDAYYCGIEENGELACWGDAVPESPPSGVFTDVVMNLEQSCAIRADQSLECWGFADGFTPMEPPSGSYLALAASDQVICALRTDGSEDCWPGLNQPSFNVGTNLVVPGVPDSGIGSEAAGLDKDGHLVAETYYVDPTIVLDTVAFGSYDSLGVSPRGRLVGFGDTRF